MNKVFDDIGFVEGGNMRAINIGNNYKPHESVKPPCEKSCKPMLD